MRIAAIVAAIVLGLVAVALDWGWITTADPRPFGWLALSFVTYLLSLLPWGDRSRP